MDWLYTKLKYFNKQQKETLVYILTRSTLGHLDDKQLSNLRYVFATLVNEEMTANDAEDIVSMIKEAVLYEKQLKLYRVARGESFGIRIDKQYEDLDDNGRKVKRVFDFTGYFIEARVRETKAVVSDSLVGNAERYQEVPVENLQLISDSLYVVDLFLKDGFDYRNILDTIFLLVGANIDNQTGTGAFGTEQGVNIGAAVGGGFAQVHEESVLVGAETELEHEIVSE